MEIKVGEYCRTKDGHIGKVENINEFRPPETKICVDINWIDLVFLAEEDIKAHSFNIIDLIEVGDYVNGYKVIEIEKTTKCVHTDYSEHLMESIAEFEIKTILTHEQYKQNCYKLEE